MLRSQLQSKAFLVGVFVKTPATELIECLARCQLDFICLDAEHSAWDRRTLDQCLGVAANLSMPALVRIAALRSELCLQALDGGAAGLVSPHIKNVEDAENFVRWSNFGPDGRGYSGSTRSAGLRGTPMAEVISREAPYLIAQIEDADALPEVTKIAETKGLDALFIGAADLTVSLGETTPSAQVVLNACDQIRAAAADANLPIAAYVAGNSDIKRARDDGVQLAFVGSDQSLLIEGGLAVANFAKETR